MLKNFTTLTELQAYHPEINLYKWGNQGQVDFSAQITMAASNVFSDLARNDVKIRKLMPELVLRSSGIVLSVDTTEANSYIDDKLNRLRLVIDCNVFTGAATKVVTLQGCNSESGTFVDVITLNITAASVLSVLFNETYTRYKVKVTVPDGTIDYKAFLIDTMYDELFYNKTLELIMRNVKRSADDGYDEKAQDFAKIYKEILNPMLPLVI